MAAISGGPKLPLLGGLKVTLLEELLLPQGRKTTLRHHHPWLKSAMLQACEYLIV
jgi:hypothetical protein